MRIEYIQNWIGEHKTFLTLAGGLLLSQLVFRFGTETRSARIIDQYIAQPLAARVDTIFSYSRGYPEVKLSTGESLTLLLPYAGQKYLQAGDSIVKKSGTRVITTYRQLRAYSEVSVFGGDRDSVDEEGLAKRYRLPVK